MNVNLGTADEINARLHTYNAGRKWWQNKALEIEAIASELAGEHSIPDLAATVANYTKSIDKAVLISLGMDIPAIKMFRLAFRRTRHMMERSVAFYEDADPSFESVMAEMFMLAVTFSFVLPFCGAIFGLEHAPAVGAAGGAFLACYLLSKVVGLFIGRVGRRGVIRIERRK